MQLKAAPLTNDTSLKVDEKHTLWFDATQSLGLSTLGTTVVAVHEKSQAAVNGVKPWWKIERIGYTDLKLNASNEEVTDIISMYKDRFLPYSISFTKGEEPLSLFGTESESDMSLATMSTYTLPTLVEVCRYQDGCRNPSCGLYHPSGNLRTGLLAHPSSPKTRRDRRRRPPSEMPCKFGDNCMKANCKFIHPSGKERTGLTADIPPMCEYGDDCVKEICSFSHPGGDKRVGLYRYKRASEVEELRGIGILEDEKEEKENFCTPCPRTHSWDKLLNEKNWWGLPAKVSEAGICVYCPRTALPRVDILARVKTNGVTYHWKDQPDGGHRYEPICHTCADTVTLFPETDDKKPRDITCVNCGCTGQVLVGRRLFKSGYQHTDDYDKADNGSYNEWLDRQENKELKSRLRMKDGWYGTSALDCNAGKTRPHFFHRKNAIGELVCRCDECSITGCWPHDWKETLKTRIEARTKRQIERMTFCHRCGCHGNISEGKIFRDGELVCRCDTCTQRGCYSLEPVEKPQKEPTRDLTQWKRPDRPCTFGDRCDFLHCPYDHPSAMMRAGLPEHLRKPTHRSKKITKYNKTRPVPYYADAGYLMDATEDRYLLQDATRSRNYHDTDFQKREWVEYNTIVLGPELKRKYGAWRARTDKMWRKDWEVEIWMPNERRWYPGRVEYRNDDNTYKCYIPEIGQACLKPPRYIRDDFRRHDALSQCCEKLTGAGLPQAIADLILEEYADTVVTTQNVHVGMVVEYENAYDKYSEPGNKLSTVYGFREGVQQEYPAPPRQNHNRNMAGLVIGWKDLEGNIKGEHMLKFAIKQAAGRTTRTTGEREIDNLSELECGQVLIWTFIADQVESGVQSEACSDGYVRKELRGSFMAHMTGDVDSQYMGDDSPEKREDMIAGYEQSQLQLGSSNRFRGVDGSEQPVRLYEVQSNPLVVNIGNRKSYREIPKHQSYRRQALFTDRPQFDLKISDCGVRTNTVTFCLQERCQLEHEELVKMSIREQQHIRWTEKLQWMFESAVEQSKLGVDIPEPAFTEGVLECFKELNECPRAKPQGTNFPIEDTRRPYLCRIPLQSTLDRREVKGPFAETDEHRFAQDMHSKVLIGSGKPVFRFENGMSRSKRKAERVRKTIYMRIMR